VAISSTGMVRLHTYEKERSHRLASLLVRIYLPIKVFFVTDIFKYVWYLIENIDLDVLNKKYLSLQK
jgi:hypothetical protein